MKKNWKYSVWVLVMLLVVSPAALAQDEEPLTDDDLKKYALVMDYADQEMERLKNDYNSLIQEQELMAGGRRFKEIKDADGDETTLAEIGATAEELEIFDKIEAANEENIAAFKEAYTEKIKDSEQLGAALYNRISKALKEDEEIKTRYQAILEQVQSERAAKTGEATSESATSEQ